MKVVCQNCGCKIIVRGLGRKAFNLPVIKVCDALRLYCNVPLVSGELECSRAYIYKVLKANGLTPAAIIKENATKDTVVGQFELKLLFNLFGVDYFCIDSIIDSQCRILYL